MKICKQGGNLYSPGLSSLGVPGVPWHTQILADQLTLFQPGGTDYAHLITTGTPGFSDLPTALLTQFQKFFSIWDPANSLQDWRAKLESAYSLMIQTVKIQCGSLTA